MKKIGFQSQIFSLIIRFFSFIVNLHMINGNRDIYYINNNEHNIFHQLLYIFQFLYLINNIEN